MGSTYNIATYSGSALYNALTLTHMLLTTGTSTAINAAAISIGALMTSTGAFMTQASSVNKGLNTIGAAINYVGDQVTFNNNKIDALNSGIGALVDADLAKESAQLQALQIRQQLGTQSLSLANQAPQTLLSLFK